MGFRSVGSRRLKLLNLGSRQYTRQRQAMALTQSAPPLAPCLRDGRMIVFT